MEIKLPVFNRSATVAATSPVRKAWHAVSIQPKGASCDAVLALRGTRFLSAQAPRLPLAQCTVPNICACAYKHHPDRRGQARRKQEAQGLRRNKVAQERRAQGERRSAN